MLYAISLSVCGSGCYCNKILALYRLKKEKELERELVERQTNAPLVNMYSTGDATTCEEFSQEYEENVRLKQYLTEQQLKKQKAKEIKRYFPRNV